MSCLITRLFLTLFDYSTYITKETLIQKTLEPGVPKLLCGGMTCLPRRPFIGATA